LAILSADKIGRFLHDAADFLLADFIGRQNQPTLRIICHALNSLQLSLDDIYHGLAEIRAFGLIINYVMLNKLELEQFKFSNS